MNEFLSLSTLLVGLIGGALLAWVLARGRLAAQVEVAVGKAEAALQGEVAQLRERVRVAIGIAASQGQFELNVYKPLIALNLQGSLRLLTDAIESFRAHCIEGIEVDAQRAEFMVANSLMGVTALVPHIGYDRASRVAHHAHAQGIALRQAALEAGGVSEAECDAWVDMRRMSMPG